MLKTTIHVQARLTWKWCRTKQGSYVGICDSLAQTVQADRFNELLATIDEALDSTFRELLSTGDLSKFLRDRQWSASGLSRITARRQRNVRFDVPFNLKAAGSRDSQEVFCQ